MVPFSTLFVLFPGCSYLFHLIVAETIPKFLNFSFHESKNQPIRYFQYDDHLSLSHHTLSYLIISHHYRCINTYRVLGPPPTFRKILALINCFKYRIACACLTFKSVSTVDLSIESCSLKYVIILLW